MRRSRKLILLILAIGAGTIGAVASTRRPVLFSFTDPGELQSPSFAVMNPLRDKAPERVANEVLSDLQRGDASGALRRIDGARSEIAHIEAKERAYPLRRWKLVNRRDAEQQVTLFFRTARGASERFDAPLTMTVQRRGGRWAVTEFDPIY